MSLVSVAAVLILLVLLAVIVRFEALLINDLARTPDEDLRLLTRKGWAVAIVIFPLGPLVYMMYGKGPRRYV